MTRNNRVFFYFLPILSILFIQGCISSGVQGGKQVQTPQSFVISDKILDSRIENIKEYLKNEEITEAKKQTALSLINSYNELKKLNNGIISKEKYKKANEVLFKSLTEVEHQFLFLGGESYDGLVKKTIEEYSFLNKQIIDDYSAGNYDKVISGCIELESRYGRNGLSPETGIVFTLALSKSRIQPEALKIARSILRELEIRPDLVNLLTNIIDLELKAGDKESASFFYEKLVDNMNEKNALLQKAGKLISEYDNEKSLPEETPDTLDLEIDPQRKIIADQILDKVKKLIEENDFDGARALLIRWNLTAEGSAEIAMIEKAQKRVDMAEKRHENSTSDNKDVISTAMDLIEEEKFLEAIDLLDKLIVEGENQEGEKMRVDAIEKLIKKEGRRASKIYRAAVDESNIQTKRELLLSSRSIINNLLEKYSLSTSNDDLKKYLLTIDDALAKLEDEE